MAHVEYCLQNNTLTFNFKVIHNHTGNTWTSIKQTLHLYYFSSKSKWSSRI